MSVNILFVGVQRNLFPVIRELLRSIGLACVSPGGYREETVFVASDERRPFVLAARTVCGLPCLPPVPTSAMGGGCHTCADAAAAHTCTSVRHKCHPAKASAILGNFAVHRAIPEVIASCEHATHTPHLVQ